MSVVHRVGTWGLAGLLAASGCRHAAPREVQFEVMGTVASVIAGVQESERAEEYAALCRDRMREIEAALSLYHPDSELCRLNAASGKGPVTVGEHLRANLALAIHFGILSGGAFDVTVGPVVKLWGFSGGRVPSECVGPERLAEVRDRVGYRRIRLTGDQAALDSANMVVDLGGIAKGYAVDVCCDELRRRGARNFVVNLAGNMRAYGRPERGRAWQIGVRDPFNTGAIIGRLELADGMSVSTSGNYERFVEIGGKRYAHIIDPRTGYPVQGMAGVTVVAPSAADADALSTALFVLGVEAGAKVIASVSNSAALFIPDLQPMEVEITPGMSKVLTPGPGIDVRAIGPESGHE